MANDDHHIGALVSASANGDTQSFKVLYDMLADRVFAYVKYRTRNVEDAADLTQEAFIALHRALPTFTYRTDEEFYGFVFTILRRSLARHYEATRNDLERTNIDPNDLPAYGENGEEQSDVERALETLDEVAREIVILHHWSRYTFGEIAAMLDMNESAVRVRHHRALKELKDHFSTTP